MAMEVLDANRLSVFVAVARERGFSRAARVLGKTQSAVSQAVLQLEKELGQPLFARDGRVARLTAPGKLLLARAERILAEMSVARSELLALDELRGGELVIGTSDTLAYYLLPPYLAAFRARYPEIELRLANRPSPATAELVFERGADLGVVTLPLPESLELGGRPARERLELVSLGPARDVVIVPPDHALARRRRVTIADLGRVPLLLLDRTTGTRAVLDRAFAAAGVVPHVAMEMSSVEVLKRLVELRFGVSIVPEIAVEREVCAGTLVARSLGGLGRARSVGLVLPRSGPPSRAALAFAELLRSSEKKGADLAREEVGRARSAK